MFFISPGSLFSGISLPLIEEVVWTSCHQITEGLLDEVTEGVGPLDLMVLYGCTESNESESKLNLCEILDLL